MGQTTDQIEAHIHNQREELGSNFHDLEHEVKAMTDWKRHFQNNPMKMLGVAFGGGILLASMIGGSKGRRRRSDFSAHPGTSEPHAATERQKYHALETWDNIKGALIGVAATRFKEFVSEMVPGFREHYKKGDQNLPASSPSNISPSHM